MLDPAKPLAFSARRWALVTVICAGLLMQLGTSLAQDSIAIPHTSVRMTPPETFVVTSDFAGLTSVEKQGLFLVAEFPADVATSFTSLFANREAAIASFAAQDITITSREVIDNANGDTIPLLRGTQEEDGIALEKWMALYLNDKVVVMITLQIPEKNALPEKVVKGAFASVRLGELADAAAAAPVQATTPVQATAPAQVTAPAAEGLASLPFDFELVAPFRVGNINPGVGLMLTVGPNDIDDSQPQMIMNLTRASPSARPLDPKDMARMTFEALGDDVVVETQEQRNFAGLAGWKTAGTVVEKGIQKRFLHWIASVDATTAAYALSYGPEDGFSELDDTIEQIAASYKLKP